MEERGKRWKKEGKRLKKEGKRMEKLGKIRGRDSGKIVRV